jgi:hypothetical protein
MEDQGWFCPTILKHIGALHPFFLLVKFCQKVKFKIQKKKKWSWRFLVIRSEVGKKGKIFQTHIFDFHCAAENIEG